MRDVEGVAARVFAEFGADDAVAATTGIGVGGVDANERRPERRNRGGDIAAHPVGDRLRHVAPHDGRRHHHDVGRAGHLDRLEADGLFDAAAADVMHGRNPRADDLAARHQRRAAVGRRRIARQGRERWGWGRRRSGRCRYRRGRRGRWRGRGWRKLLRARNRLRDGHEHRTRHGERRRYSGRRARRGDRR